MNNYNMFNGLGFERKYSKWYNDTTFFDYYTRLKEIAINEFEWINLPETCDARFLELTLFEFGYALFFQDNLNKAFFTLQSTISGPWNIYRIPTVRRAYAVTGYNQECYDTDSVIIFNNYLRLPTNLTIELYAQRLTLAERAINVNVNAQKTPILIRGSQEQQRTLRSIYEKYEGNEPVIFGDKEINIDTLQVLKTDAPNRYLELMQYKNLIWNEALAFLGVESSNTTKRERLTNGEVDASNRQVEMSKYNRLNARKDACKMINQLFADQLEKEVDVRFRLEGMEDNGDIYDGITDSLRSNNGADGEGRVSAD